MPFSNGFSRRNFFFLAVIALAGLLSACGNTTTATPSGNSTPAAAFQTSPPAPVTTPASGPTATAPQANPPDTGTNAPPMTIPTSAGATPASMQATPGQAKLTTAPAIITKANGEKINMTVELARTAQEQETGLMGRQNVPDETGMLFIFPQSGRIAFWMKDTPLALSIAFITQDGKIIDIQDMESFSLDTHSPNQDYIYALEVAKGYFARKGVKPGDTFTFQS